SALMERALAQPDMALVQINTLNESDLAWLPSLDQPIVKTRFASPVDRFLQHAAQTPQAIAIETPQRRYQYAELAAASAGISHWLQAEAVGPGEQVAILATRSAGLIASV